MERRKISFDPKPSQQELPLESAPARRRIADLSALTEVHVRLPKDVAAAILKADSNAVEQHLEREAQRELDAMLTAWSRDRPPCSGYWELKQRSVITPDDHNWWYSAPINKWHRGVPQTDSAMAGFVDHGVLMQGYEWRGLKLRFAGGYPYELEYPAFASSPVLGDGASQDVKRSGAFADTTLPDLNPNLARRRIVL